MYHLAGFYQSAITTGALSPIAAIADQAIRTDGVDLVVPSAVSNLIFEAALSGATTVSAAQVQSPSLRQLANQDVRPIVAGAVFGDLPPIQFHGSNPRALMANESLNFAMNTTDTDAAASYGLIALSDGATSKTTGKAFTVTATADAKLVAGQWVNAPLTFDNTLPAGSYNIVGFRAEGTNLVASRLVFVGAAFRPGVPAVNTVSQRDLDIFRYGHIGSFGTFDVNQPPTVDCLGDKDTSQSITLDIIKLT